MNTKLSEALKGNKNAAKDYAKKLAEEAGAKAGGLEEKARFTATGARIGFRFGSALENAVKTNTTMRMNGSIIQQKTESTFKNASMRMAVTGAKLGSKLADISPVGEISGRRKAAKAFDAATDSIKRRMWGN